MNQDKWKEFFQNSPDSIHVCWIKVMLSDGKHFFFFNHKKWLEVKDYCKQKKTNVTEIELQFRSHCVKINIEKKSEATYLVKASGGLLGSPVSKEFIVIGQLINGIMTKEYWLIPELVLDETIDSKLEECISEGIIYNEEKKEN